MPENAPPAVTRENALFSRVEGVFYRAIQPAYRDHAIAGSVVAGRYSAASQPTLYLSASVAGVDAAMIAHGGRDEPRREIILVDVSAADILDLRDENVCRAAAIKQSDAAAPWQEVVADGRHPRSWAVRERAIELGANGLIDPSRKSPGLWHLVLFVWNTVDVRVAVHGVSNS